ncbi:MAG: class II SORL domain-containing protein [Anaerolineaceae bacterium]|nr:class II SORL domain-containing protein [Anaerolineaceae bacterium]
MSEFGSLVQSADWKKEKHSPSIDAPESVKAGELFTVEFGIGKEIAHPNTTAHHIAYISLFFKPDSEKFAHQVAHVDFSAHGESARGEDANPVFTEPFASVKVKLNESGTFYALSFCNIHGLWESSKEIKVG